MKRAIGFAVILLAVLAGGSQLGHAGGIGFPKIENAATVKECGACHLVYFPQMLPQRSWMTIMGGLDSHFGEVASVNDATKLEILTYLLANASDSPDKLDYARLARGIGADVIPIRVTEMPWWRGGEGHRPGKGAANCTSSRCHAGADKSGFFGENE